MRKGREQRDYVVGLISGRMVNQRDVEGKMVQVFKPQVHNRYLPISRLLAQKSERLTEDDVLVGEGLRNRHVRIDRSWFAKSDKDTQALKKAKREHGKSVRKAGFNPRFRLNAGEPQVLRQS